MLDQGDRDIVDLEPHRRLGMHVEGMRQRRPNRAAMRRRHDVAAAILVGQAVDRAHRAIAQVAEALAARRPEFRRREPEQMAVAGLVRDLGIGEALPFAERLLGEIGIDHDLAELGAGLAEMLRGLARAQQVRRVPDRAFRQELRLVLEQILVADVAILVELAVAAAFGVRHRRVPHPPPTRHRSRVLGRQCHFNSFYVMKHEGSDDQTAISPSAGRRPTCRRYSRRGAGRSSATRTTPPRSPRPAQ